MEFYLRFDSGIPQGTAQEKGECIRYKTSNGRRVPYIHHFKKANVQGARTEYELKLKRYKPRKPSDKPIRLTIIFYYSIKGPQKIWGKYKTKRPDCDNAAKELIDAMSGFWLDDAQIVDLHIKKYYAEKATIYIKVEELSDD